VPLLLLLLCGHRIIMPLLLLLLLLCGHRIIIA
jgi:hypothetical protein